MRDGSMDDAMSVRSQSSRCSDFIGFPNCSDIDMEAVNNSRNKRSASAHDVIEASQRVANEAPAASIQTNLSYIEKENSTDSGIGNDSLQTTKDKSNESCQETSQAIEISEPTTERSLDRTTGTTERSLDDLEDWRIALSGDPNNVQGTSMGAKVNIILLV